MTNFEYALMPEEILKFHEFQGAHRNCKPEVREALIEEDAAPILFEIKLYMTSIGMCPAAVCNVCRAEKSIMCHKREDSF